MHVTEFENTQGKLIM